MVFADCVAAGRLAVSVFEVRVMAGPSICGGVPVSMALLVNEPAAWSTVVTTCEQRKVALAPGSSELAPPERVAASQLSNERLLSASGTEPVFFTRNSRWTVCPSGATIAAVV